VALTVARAAYMVLFALNGFRAAFFLTLLRPSSTTDLCPLISCGHLFGSSRYV